MIRDTARMTNEDERRRQAFLNYAKARLKIAKETGNKKEIAHFEREIRLLEDGKTRD